MPQPRGYVDADYLQAAGGLFAPIKRRSYALMRVQPGQKVLDVGCGPGIDTLLLAELVGPAGQVVGLDYSPSMLVQAKQGALRAGVSEFVLYLQSDAASLALASEQFDSCRSERLFSHLPHPERVLSDMKRVTKPGGWIVVLDMDWGSVSVDTKELDIERRLRSFIAEHALQNGYAGRQLYRLFRQQDLVDITLEIFPIHSTDYALVRYLGRLDEVESKALAAGLITESELQRWRAELEQMQRADCLFFSINLIVAVGRKA
jgi:ubiquinone/menaquinone biosynthesis C-methylase UbiE